jgi:hypothetical protein
VIIGEANEDTEKVTPPTTEGFVGTGEPRVEVGSTFVLVPTNRTLEDRTIVSSPTIVGV